MTTTLRTIRGPALFLAQFIGTEPPFDTLPGLAEWAASNGYRALQIPTNAPHLFDLARAAESDAYCEEIRAMLASFGLEISELSTHIQGQLVAVHPAYDALFAPFAPEPLRGDREAMRAWAVEQLGLAAEASRRLGLTRHATFSGALAWPYLYPWPQRPKGLIETAFQELAARWRPILDRFDAAGVDLCFELHPGEDLHDGTSFARFLEAVDHHPRCAILFDPSHFVLQQLDYLAFIDRWHSRIRAFHVKDAEFRPTADQGVYGGYADWIDRAGRFRSIGDGQVDFGAIFSKLSQYGFDGWAVLEWECCLKSPAVGAAEGAVRSRDYIIEVTDRPFDDFAGISLTEREARAVLGVTTKE